MPNFWPAQPARFIAGMTQNFDFQPLGSLPAEDPFFTAQYADDFTPYAVGNYTITGTGGTVAPTAGPGGLVTLTAAATASDSCVLQSGTPNVGQFAIQSTNRLWYGARVQVSALSANATYNMGLVESGATVASITDGIWFSLSGTGTFTINSAASSVLTSASLASIFLPTAATFFDIAFEYQAFSTIGANIVVWAGTNLWGAKAAGQNSANLGPIVRLQPASVTTANLTPTLMVGTSAATSYTLTADFQMAALER